MLSGRCHSCQGGVIFVKVRSQPLSKLLPALGFKKNQRCSQNPWISLESLESPCFVALSGKSLPVLSA